VPLAEVARQRGLQLRRLQRWMRAYRHQGLAGLARKPYPDRGHPTLSAPLQQLIEGLALRRPRLSCAAVHREVVAVANEHGWPPPSYDTVYGIICRLDAALVTLAHQGVKVYADRYDLLYRREASRSNVRDARGRSGLWRWCR